MKSMVFLLISLLATRAYTAPVVDVYGTNPQTKSNILKKYALPITRIEHQLARLVFQPNSEAKTKELSHLFHEKQLIVQSIMRENNFSYVNFQTVQYPDTKNNYTTIEVIEKNQPQRMRFVNIPRLANPSKNHSAPAIVKDDIIEKMHDYVILALKLVMAHKEPAVGLNCPVFHCISEFKHAKLKPYLSLFNMAATHQKKFIVDTLNQDIDPDRRANAAFLIGHFKDPNEIVQLLLPHVNDSNDGVRNNVLRVIGATIDKAKLSQFEVKPFLELLDSPYLTDRNKALFILLTAADSPQSKSYILQHGKQRILSILQLQQPNNHRMAYSLLQKLSDQKFSEYDQAAWEKWWHSMEDPNSPGTSSLASLPKTYVMSSIARHLPSIRRSLTS